MGRNEANEEFYVWDRVISMIHEDHLTDNMEFGGDLRSIDEITRVMARENRTGRRALGRAFIEFMDRRDIESRLLLGTSDTAYVFLKKPHAEDRKYRTREFELRVWVARAEMHKRGHSGPVNGIGTEIREPGSESSLDTVLLQKPTWTEEDAKFVESMRQDFRLFANSYLHNTGVNEYPSP